MSRFLDALGMDVRAAFRRAAAAPAFTAMAVATLAVGIGVAGATVHVIERVVLRSLPGVAEAEELVLLHWRSAVQPKARYITGDWRLESRGGPVVASVLSYPEFERLRGPDTGLSAVVACADHRSQRVRFGRDAEIVSVHAVSGAYFDALGVAMARGRTLQEADDRPGADVVAIVSHSFWQRHMGGDPGVIGRRGTVGDRPVEIVGVAAGEFGGTLNWIDPPDLWIPLAAHRAVTRDWNDDRAFWLQVLARLEGGVTRELAEERVAAVLNEDAESGRRFRLISGRRGWTLGREQSRGLLVGVGLVVGLLFLVICANVGGWLVARTEERWSETALRRALGAGPGDLLRQSLVEAGVLSALGGLLSLAMAYGLARTMAARLDVAATVLGSTVPVLSVTAVLSVAAALLVGWGASLVTTRQGSSLPTKRPSRRGEVLVVAQLAVSMVLLVAALGTVRTLQRSLAIDPGFSRDVQLFRLDVPEAADIPRILERLRAFPGVAAAGVSTQAALSLNSTQTIVTVKGEGIGVTTEWVGGDFFGALGIRVLAGRSFDGPTTGPSAMVVNEAFVRRYMGGEGALGQVVSDRRVIGVVADVRYVGLWETTPTPMVFLPFEARGGRSASVVVRLAQEASPQALLPGLRRLVSDVAPGAVAFDFTTPARQIARHTRNERLLAEVASTVAVVTVALAALGLAGLLAHAVSRRTREIGIRVAVGATSGDVGRLVLGRGMKLVSAGVLQGVAAILLGRPVLSNVLGIGEAVGFSLVAPPVVLLLVASLAACLWPLRRALRLDPVQALRCE